MELVYLSGPPAAGKSTLMAELLRWVQKVDRAKPFAHQLLLSRNGEPIGAELGRNRASFPGTDTLSMSVAPVARRWLMDCRLPLVLGEGDRLANPGFLHAAQDAGRHVTLVYLTADPATLDVRCSTRGSDQNASWRQGRVTKAENLARWAKRNGVTVLPADSTRFAPELLAASLRHYVPSLNELCPPEHRTSP